MLCHRAHSQAEQEEKRDAKNDAEAAAEKAKQELCPKVATRPFSPLGRGLRKEPVWRLDSGSSHQG